MSVSMCLCIGVCGAVCKHDCGLTMCSRVSARMHAREHLPLGVDECGRAGVLHVSRYVCLCVRYGVPGHGVIVGL